MQLTKKVHPTVYTTFCAYNAQNYYDVIPCSQWHMKPPSPLLYSIASCTCSLRGSGPYFKGNYCTTRVHVQCTYSWDLLVHGYRSIQTLHYADTIHSCWYQQTNTTE